MIMKSSPDFKNEPSTLLITRAIEFAENGQREEAIELLNVVESRDIGHDLIQLVRLKYRLPADLQEELIKFSPESMIGFGVDKPLPGVSLVNCARNRTENLLLAMPTWLSLEEIKEIIIIDWCSDVPVLEELKLAGIVDKRVKVIRVVDEPRWILSYPFNLGFRLAKYERILKVDADITLKPNFFKANPLIAGTFIAGDWQKAAKGQEHINGFFYIRQIDLLRIKGFNEYITTYGWDDDDIYTRMTESGLHRKCVDVDSIYHIPHDDSLRMDQVKSNEENAWTELQRDTLFKIRANRYLTLVMPYWNGERQFAPFKILEANNSGLIVKRVVDDLPHKVSATTRLHAELYAAMELLSWRLGTSVYHLDEHVFRDLLSIKLLHQITRFDIWLLSRDGSKISSIKPKSVYVDFGRYQDPDADLSGLIRWLKQSINFNDTSVFVSFAGGQLVHRFKKEVNFPIVHLDFWVLVDGLTKFDPQNHEHLSSNIAETLHIDVDKEVLDKLSSLNLEDQNTNVTSEPISRKKLYIDVQHGLGNRMRALASAMAVAESSGRDLILCWEPDSHCDCNYSDLFKTPLKEESRDSVVKKFASMDVYNYMEIEGGIKNELIDTDSQNDIYIKAAFVLNSPLSNWDVENAQMRKLETSDIVSQLVNEIKLPDNCIGLHVRNAGLESNAGDYDKADGNWLSEDQNEILKWRAASDCSKFLAKLADLKKNSKVFFYLATDKQENYDVFLGQHQNEMAYLKREKYDRSKEQLYYALADAILLSRCNKLLGSNWSSFTELAMRLSPHKLSLELSGVDF